jgi:hypothetical protein
MIENTPIQVANWLRAMLEVTESDDPDRSILDRLANDDRMRGLWDTNEAGNWPPQSQVRLIEVAFWYATRAIISALLLQPEWRITLAKPQYSFAIYASCLAEAIKNNPDEAARLWAAVGIIDGRKYDSAEITDLANRLNDFAARASREAEQLRSTFDHLPAPSRQGPGDRRQLAYRAAIGGALIVLNLPHEQRDQIVALLTSVVFGRDLDAETIARTRQRQRRRQRPSNHSSS